MTRDVHLLAFGITRSSGPWRHPDIDNSTAGVRQRLISHAQTAEAGGFDALFFADGLNFGPPATWAYKNHRGLRTADYHRDAVLRHRTYRACGDRVSDTAISATRGAARDGKDPIAIAKEWRALAVAKNLSLRQVAIETSARSGFVGTPGQVADELARWVRAGATDGFNISPYIVPGGLDEVVDWLVPELQERGVYRTEYTSTTLRGHLGLRAPLTRRHSTETHSSATG